MEKSVKQMAIFKPQYLTVFMAAVILFYSCGKKEKEKPVTKVVVADPSNVLAIGRIEPLDKIITLYPEVNGVVTKLNVSLGDTVKKGEVIAELELSEEAASVESAKAQLATQKSNIESSQAEVVRARMNVEYWEDQFKRFSEAFAKNAATKQEISSAENNLKSAKADLQKQQALLESAKSRTAELQAQVSVSSAKLSDRVIKAPSDGVMLSLDIARGTLVSPSTAIGQFAAASPVISLCEVDELYANRIKTGQSAIVRMQGAGDTLATGKVIAAAPFLRQKSLFSDEIGNLEDRRVREVKVEIVQGKENLLLGMRVETIINLK
jgi:HlyD family secretion protein